MTRLPALVCLLVPSLVGCAGLFESDDEPSKTVGDASIAGSYDLTFANVRPDPEAGHGTYAPPPSLGTTIRLDIRARDGGGYEAVVTPLWGEPVPYDVRVDDRRLVFTGEGTVRSGNPGGLLTDRWSSLALDRQADGSLAVAFAGSGTEEVMLGDVADSYPITGVGTIAPDKTAPALRLEPFPPHGPEDRLLPWDPVLLRASEGIMGFAGGLEASGVAWADLPVPTGAWTGDVLARGTLGSWDAGGLLALRQVGPLADPAGNPSQSPLPGIEILPVGSPAAGFDLDTDIAPAHWGSVGFLGGVRSPDPACEHGGCATLGPVRSLACAPPRVGIAGRLRTADATQILVRYRVLYGKNPMSPDEKPTIWSAPLGVDVISHAGDVTSQQATPSADALAPLSPPVLGMEWGTDWATLTVPIEPQAGDAGERGFVVYAGSPGFPSCNMPLPASPDVIVVVDSILVTR